MNIQYVHVDIVCISEIKNIAENTIIFINIFILLLFYIFVSNENVNKKYNFY